jgi:hypothetical protein
VNLGFRLESRGHQISNLVAQVCVWIWTGPLHSLALVSMLIRLDLGGWTPLTGVG